MISELKPCPFCGGEARLLLNAKRKIYGKDKYKTGVVACCNVCEARMFYGSKKLAIEAWNRRVIKDFPSAYSGRKKGKWIFHEGYDECSVCHVNTFVGLNYCPNCGVDMRGEANGK